MVIHNEDIREITAEIREGHNHLRTTIVLHDDREFTFQEAAMANLVRAYIVVKTHPTRCRVHLQGVKLDERKAGYAEWQLVESD